MDGNKDAALLCIDLAQQSLAKGKIAKAEKLMLKAAKLYPKGGDPPQHCRCHRHQDGEEPHSAALINFLPVLLVIGLVIWSHFLAANPVYSLTGSYKYPVKRQTNGLKVPYYVEETFNSDYPGSVKLLEESVEKDFLNQLKNSCNREQGERDSRLSTARVFNDQKMYRKAQDMETPSCDNLQKFYALLNGQGPGALW